VLNVCLIFSALFKIKVICVITVFFLFRLCVSTIWSIKMVMSFSQYLLPFVPARFISPLSVRAITGSTYCPVS